MKDARRAPIGRRLPPLLVLSLVVTWLLLTTWSLAQVVLGTLLAAALVRASAVLRPLRPTVRRLHVAARLAGVVVGDILRSNVGVARIMLGLTSQRRIASGFVEIPLELRDPHALAVLAAIVTSTPGTVWVDHDAAAQLLTLHVLDLRDEQQWIDWIKSRYERPLRRIFE
jgi:multicomponent K+:H+ antiporter subunit E